MSQPSSNDEMFGEVGGPVGMDEMPEVEAPVQYRKPEFNIYSMMILLSFLFMTTAAILLINTIK